MNCIIWQDFSWCREFVSLRRCIVTLGSWHSRRSPWADRLGLEIDTHRTLYLREGQEGQLEVRAWAGLDLKKGSKLMRRTQVCEVCSKIAFHSILWGGEELQKAGNLGHQWMLHERIVILADFVLNNFKPILRDQWRTYTIDYIQ